MKISDGFQTLLARIAPLRIEIDAVEGHIATIRRRLAEAYSLKAFVPAGSYPSRSSKRQRSAFCSRLIVVAKISNCPASIFWMVRGARSANSANFSWVSPAERRCRRKFSPMDFNHWRFAVDELGADTPY